MSKKIQLDDWTDIDPICPHCEETIRKLLCRQIESSLGVRYLYYCDRCHKVLGISHRKGFWMG